MIANGYWHYRKQLGPSPPGLHGPYSQINIRHATRIQGEGVVSKSI